MKIFNLKQVETEMEVRLSVSIDSQNLGKKDLWFSVPKEFANALCTSRMDGFLVGMLFPAMWYGEDLVVEGCVSQKLFFNLKNYAKHVLKVFCPTCKEIEICVTDVDNRRIKCKGVGTGFSGGIDSFSTIYNRFENETDSDFKINSFLFLNVGSHGCQDLENANEVFAKLFNYLSEFTATINLPFIPLNSNLHSFHPWGHQLTCSLTMAAGVLILQNWFNKYYCASLGWSYLETFKFYKTDLNRDIAFLDPILLPLLSTESLDLIPDGTEYSRTEKVMRIVEYEPVRKYLNVCVNLNNSYENCSICSKCCRTLMTLKSIGKIDKFSNLFDIEKYERVAEFKYVCKQVLIAGSDPFARGNVELAKNNNVKLPNKLICIGLFLISALKKIGKALLCPFCKRA